MLQWGSEKLTQLRNRMPDAGGLVIAPSIEMAEHMVSLLEHLEGERPILVHSQLPAPDSRIKTFRNTDRRWLVSVAMVSEGVDIKRLRVLVYLPNALTELAFRQAVGRVVRTAGPDDDTRAYVVMPSFDTFECYARRVEDEMSPSARLGGQEPRTKRCPSCAHECGLGAHVCPECGHEFPVRPHGYKPCKECGALNALTASSCHQCGASLGHTFCLTLDEALRTGAIVRGMDIDEVDVQAAEQMAPAVRQLVLQSGDQRLVRILQTLPDESWARLRSILMANG
jgi:superfamily II DNA or RNA helicase